MATAESVKAKIERLIDTANDTTKHDDRTLTECVDTLIDGFNSGSKPQVTKWQRPEDWPNYDYIDRTNMEAVFYTYDCRSPADNPRILRDACLKTTVTGGSVLYEQGYIDANGFTATYSETLGSDVAFRRDLPSDAGDYVVYRVTPADEDKHITSISFSQGTCSVQYCVERWGRLPLLTTLSGTNSLISDSIIDCVNINRLNNAWDGCSNLQSLDLSGWDVSGVTNLIRAWNNCSNLQSLDLSGWDVSGVANLNRAWNNCSNLQSLDISGWDVSGVANLNSTWNNCYGLTVYHPAVIKKSHSLSFSSYLDSQSLADIIDTLPTVETEQTLSLSAASKTLLTDEQIASANAKGWTIA